MYWQQRPNPLNWMDQIRYFSDSDNKLSVDELRDAFINLAHLYAFEHANVKLLEDAIMEAFGDKGESFIGIATTETDLAKEVSKADTNSNDSRDILGSTLNLIDYIEDTWY